jgi:membrane-bound inhibitor of C-type lysozyme
MPLDRKPRMKPALFASAAVLALGVLAACETSPSKEAAEAARNTFACQLAGERIVIRFDADEARILMPGGARVNLYQIPSASGVRYTNGAMELRGKGTDLQLIRDGTLTSLDGCAPYVPPPV